MQPFNKRTALSAGRRALKAVFKDIVPIIGRAGLGIREEKDYDWDDHGEDMPLAVYESGSVFEKEILIAINFDEIYRQVSRDLSDYPSFTEPFDEMDEAVKISAWHEAVHGLWEYLEDQIEYNAELVESLRLNETKAYREFLENEEEAVENAAIAFYEGWPEANPRCRFLEEALDAVTR